MMSLQLNLRGVFLTARVRLVMLFAKIRGVSSRTRRGKSATYLIAEYHRGRLQNNFGTGFVEWPSELPFYYS